MPAREGRRWQRMQASRGQIMGRKPGRKWSAVGSPPPPSWYLFPRDPADWRLPLCRLPHASHQGQNEGAFLLVTKTCEGRTALCGLTTALRRTILHHHKEAHVCTVSSVHVYTALLQRPHCRVCGPPLLYLMHSEPSEDLDLTTCLKCTTADGQGYF